MARILLTGMCCVQDRLTVELSRVFGFLQPFPSEVRTKAQFLRDFSLAKNTGNYLITEGAFRSVEGHDVVYVPFWKVYANIQSQEYISLVRESFDFCLYATANILNADFDISADVDVLEALSIPTIFTSIGVQRVTDLAGEISLSATRFVEFLKRDTSFSFTRGRFAYEFLSRIGVKNVFEACCPSAFYRPDAIIAGVSALKNLEADGFDEVWVNGYLHAPPSGGITDVGVFRTNCRKVCLCFPR